jgi:hypothetical protein
MQHNTLLDEAKSHFDHWRATRTKRGKIPGYLWEKVKPLINHYHLTAITRALNINTNQIREHLKLDENVNFVEAQTEALPLQTRQPIISLSPDSQTCSIELHRVGGCVLKINALPVASLPAIITQFMV